jgi:hypothetical protein
MGGGDQNKFVSVNISLYNSVIIYKFVFELFVGTRQYINTAHGGGSIPHIPPVITPLTQNMVCLGEDYSTKNTV